VGYHLDSRITFEIVGLEIVGLQELALSTTPGDSRVRLGLGLGFG
jgi:hypothetical protein